MQKMWVLCLEKIRIKKNETPFRLYGPLEPWFDKTWKPDDFELVK